MDDRIKIDVPKVPRTTFAGQPMVVVPKISLILSEEAQASADLQPPTEAPDMADEVGGAAGEEGA